MGACSSRHHLMRVTPRAFSVDDEGPPLHQPVTVSQCPDQEGGKDGGNRTGRYLVKPALRAVTGPSDAEPHAQGSVGIGALIARVRPPG